MSCRVDLGVDTNIPEVWDLKTIKMNHLTSTVDLQNQGHKYILQGWDQDLLGRDRDQDRDLSSRDRDVCQTVRDETETRPSSVRDETETRPFSCRDYIEKWLIYAWYMHFTLCPKKRIPQTRMKKKNK